MLESVGNTLRHAQNTFEPTLVGVRSCQVFVSFANVAAFQWLLFMVLMLLPVEDCCFPVLMLRRKEQPLQSCFLHGSVCLVSFTFPAALALPAMQS